MGLSPEAPVLDMFSWQKDAKSIACHASELRRSRPLYVRVSALDFYVGRFRVSGFGFRAAAVTLDASERSSRCIHTEHGCAAKRNRFLEVPDCKFCLQDIVRPRNTVPALLRDNLVLLQRSGQLVVPI